MSHYLDRDEAGHEKPNYPDTGWRKPGPPCVKNKKCPIDGHYCEQPHCENCQYEKIGQ